MEAVVGVGTAFLWVVALAIYRDIDARLEGRRNEERILLPAERENQGRATSSGSQPVLGNPSEGTRNREALYQAIIQSSLPEIQLLVKSGVDLKYQYEDEKTALHLACENGSLDV